LPIKSTVNAWTPLLKGEISISTPAVADHCHISQSIPTIHPSINQFIHSLINFIAIDFLVV